MLSTEPPQMLGLQSMYVLLVSALTASVTERQTSMYRSGSMPHDIQ